MGKNQTFKVKNNSVTRAESKNTFLNLFLNKLDQEIISLGTNNKQIKGDNITKAERAAITSLKNNKDIVINKADRGSTIVALNKCNYIEEGLKNPDEPKVYKQLKADTTAFIRTYIMKFLVEQGHFGNPIHTYWPDIEHDTLLNAISRGGGGGGGGHCVGDCTPTRDRGQSEVKRSRRNFEAGQAVKLGIGGSLRTVKVSPGDRWAWLMLDSQGSMPDFRCGQRVKHENLLGQDLDRGRGWEYTRLCSVLWGAVCVKINFCEIFIFHG